MGLKSLLSLPFAKLIVKKNNQWKKNAVKVQNTLLLSLINQAKNTKFGKAILSKSNCLFIIK